MSTRCRHESGPAQLEINFNHGDPLELADQVFLFKRTVRQAALKHDMYATFMAKPHENEPGSSMHIHQSVMDVKTGKNIFRRPRRQAVEALPQSHWRAAALYGGGAAVLRAQCELLSPAGAEFRCADQRPLGDRQPHRALARPVIRSGDNLRVENRVPGADANPYLAFAASLACGYLGMVEKIKPSDPVEGSAYRYAHTLPHQSRRGARQAQLHQVAQAGDGREIRRGLSRDVKYEEMQQYRKVISSWEREFLLLNV